MNKFDKAIDVFGCENRFEQFRIMWHAAKKHYIQFDKDEEWEECFPCEMMENFCNLKIVLNCGQVVIWDDILKDYHFPDKERQSKG